LSDRKESFMALCETPLPADGDQEELRVAV
jgi:hypothetical protein